MCVMLRRRTREWRSKLCGRRDRSDGRGKDCVRIGCSYAERARRSVHRRILSVHDPVLQFLDRRVSSISKDVSPVGKCLLKVVLSRGLNFIFFIVFRVDWTWRLMESARASCLTQGTVATELT